MDVEQVRWVAHLARLDLSESEMAVMAEQLGAILNYVEKLKRIDTTGVEPLAHPLSLHTVFRDDQSTPSLPVEQALANAPARVDHYFSVPAVLD